MTNLLIAGGHFKSGGTVDAALLKSSQTVDAPKFFRKRNSLPRVKNFAEIIRETS